MLRFSFCGEAGSILTEAGIFALAPSRLQAGLGSLQMIRDRVDHVVSRAIFQELRGKVDVVETIEDLLDLAMGALIKYGAGTLRKRKQEPRAGRVVVGRLTLKKELNVAFDL